MPFLLEYVVINKIIDTAFCSSPSNICVKLVDCSCGINQFTKIFYTLKIFLLIVSPLLHLLHLSQYTIQSAQKFCGTYDLFQLAVIVKQKIGVLHVWYVCTKAKNIKLTPREDFSILFLSLIAGHQLFILVYYEGTKM